MDFWDQLYQALGIKDFVYLVSSPELQDYLFPVKLIFSLFSAFFLAAVIYFMINSSWLKYKFFEDVVEFFSWQSYGAREIEKRWQKIKNRLGARSEAEYKLAVIEADDFFKQVLEEGGYGAETFEESIKRAGHLLDAMGHEVEMAHETRNSIVYDPNFALSEDRAKRVLEIYESAVNGVGLQ